jgi:oligoendopeptidase F
MCAATTVGQKILEEGEEMRNKYIDEFLSAGSSDYAIPILKRIGVDMTAGEPYEVAFRRMEETMDQIEQLL